MNFLWNRTGGKTDSPMICAPNSNSAHFINARMIRFILIRRFGKLPYGKLFILFAVHSIPSSVPH